MLDTDNLLGIARAVSTVAILSLGLLVVIIAGEIDLSFANLYGLSTNVVAVALADARVAGLPRDPRSPSRSPSSWGCFNAFFTAVVGIPSFIATLGLEHADLRRDPVHRRDPDSYSAEFPEDGTPPPASELELLPGPLQPGPAVRHPDAGALDGRRCMVVFGFLLGRSLFGFRLKAIGGNREAARARPPARAALHLHRLHHLRLHGLPRRACSTSPSSARPAPNDGQANLFPVFAAVIIGGASLVRRPRHRHRHALRRAPAGRAQQRPRAGGRRAVRVSRRCSAP